MATWTMRAVSCSLVDAMAIVANATASFIDDRRMIDFTVGMECGSIDRSRNPSPRSSQVSDGSLYPALHKLEQEGWISAEWKASDNNRRAKFYSLTRLGRKQLDREAANWTRLSDAISQILRIEEA